MGHETVLDPHKNKHFCIQKFVMIKLREMQCKELKEIEIAKYHIKKISIEQFNIYQIQEREEKRNELIHPRSMTTMDNHS